MRGASVHTRRTTAGGRTTVNLKEAGRAGGLHARLPLCAVAPVPPRCGEYALTPRRCVAAAQRSEMKEMQTDRRGASARGVWTRGRAHGAGARRRAVGGTRSSLEASAVPRTLLELKLRRALTHKPMFAFRKDPVAISMVEYIT